MHTYSIVGYIYRADNYCVGCIEDAVVDSLSTEEREQGWGSVYRPCMTEVAHEFDIDPDDEASYDSDEFPKVIFADQCEEGERCGSCFEELMER